MEPDAHQRAAGGVADQHLQPAPAASRFLGLEDPAGDHRALADGRLRHRSRRAPVFVLAREIEQEIADGPQALGLQLLGDGGPHAAQLDHRRRQWIRRSFRSGGLRGHGRQLARTPRHRPRKGRDFQRDRQKRAQLPHQRGDGPLAVRLARLVEAVHALSQPLQPRGGGLAGVGPGLLDDLRHQRLEPGEARDARPRRESQRLKERRQREGKPGVTLAQRYSPSSISYSRNSTSSTSYSRSPPGVRIFTVSPTSRPIKPRAMGLVMLIRPFFRSASVSPAMVYCTFWPDSLSSSLTVAPNITRSPESFETSMISARANRSSSIWIRPSMCDCFSLAAWYSAFSRRSPCSRAVAISCTFFGRSTLFRGLSSRLVASAPALVIRIWFPALAPPCAGKRHAAGPRSVRPREKMIAAGTG